MEIKGAYGGAIDDPPPGGVPIRPKLNAVPIVAPDSRYKYLNFGSIEDALLVIAGSVIVPDVALTTRDASKLIPSEIVTEDPCNDKK
jgi:hypothetical protein